MQAINFSNDNIERLTLITNTLGNTLIEAGFGLRADQLVQIKLAAEQHDKENFERLVVNRELFGGAGALWEIWIENKQLQKKFEKQFCEFIDLLKKMGVNNGRINQVREGFNSK